MIKISIFMSNSQLFSLTEMGPYVESVLNYLIHHSFDDVGRKTYFKRAGADWLHWS